MARIRTMKPEYWGDEKLAPLAPIHRLVFLGLISQADDAGRLLDSVRYIDGLLFSRTDDQSCAESLIVLSEIEVIERGCTASGQPVIQITNWTRHQKIEKPNLKGALPPIARRKRRSGATNGTSEIADLIPDESGNGRGGVGEESENGSPESRRTDLGPTTFDLGPTTNDLRAGTVARAPGDASPDFDGYTPTEAQTARAAELHVDLDSTLRTWRAKRKAKGARPVDLAADFDGWLEDQPGFTRNGSNGNGAVHAETPSGPARVAPYVPPPEPEVSPEQRAEIARLAAEKRAALRGDATPEPRKRRSQLTREQQLSAAARMAKGEEP